MAIRNTENLTNLLTDLADYRMMLLSQVFRLHFTKERAARRRMRQLVDEGLVELLPGPPAQKAGRPESVYGLSKEGMQFLKIQGALESDLTFEQVGGGNLSHQAAHQLLLGWFRVHLAHTCKSLPDLECRLLTFNSPLALDTDTTAPIIRDEVVLEDDASPVRFIPDAAFILIDTARRKPVLFFFEADMGTEPLSSEGRGDIRDKVNRYKQYFRSLGYKRYETLWGGSLNGFRVLFFADSSADTTRRATPARARSF